MTHVIIHVDSFVKKYGEQSKLLIKLAKGDPIDYLTIRFLYPDKGICLLNEGSVFGLSSKNLLVNRTMGIKEIYFTGSLYPDEQLTTGCLRGINEKEYESHVQNWNGYGKYNVIHR